MESDTPGRRAGSPPLPPSWRTYRSVYVISDGHAQVVEADPELLALTGAPAIASQAPDSWVNFVHPDDLGHAYEAFRQLSDGRAWSGRLRIRTETGWLALDVWTEVEPQEDAKRVTALVRDVTAESDMRAALVERDARLRLLNEAVPMVMWRTDKDLCLTWLAGSALDAFALDEARSLEGHVSEVFGERSGAGEASQKALERNPSGFNLPSSRGAFHAFVDALEDDRGEVIGTIGVAVSVDAASMVAGVVRGMNVGGVSIDDAIPAPQDYGFEKVRSGPIEIDTESFTVRKDGRIVPLTITEFKLLLEFSRRPGRVLSREVLAERVWGYEYVGTRSTVAMAVKRLRDKIEDDPSNPQLIETVRGLGYRFIPPGTR